MSFRAGFLIIAASFIFHVSISFPSTDSRINRFSSLDMTSMLRCKIIERSWMVIVSLILSLPLADCVYLRLLCDRIQLQVHE